MSRPNQGEFIMFKIRRRSLFALLSLLLLVACEGDELACPEADTPETGEALLEATLTLVGSDGGAPTAGDTLWSTLELVNRGVHSAAGLVLTLPLFDHFEYLGASSTSQASITVDEGTVTAVVPILPSVDSMSLSLSFTIPEFFPAGRVLSAQAEIQYDEDGNVQTPPIELRSSPPGVSGSEEPTSVTIENEGMNFTLLAPGVPEVYLSGDFNGWSLPTPDYLMFPDDEGRLWAMTLPIQGRYEYKFILRKPGSSDVWIGDPRAQRVASDGLGGLNSVAGLPLPGSPSPLAGGIDPTRLVIYELLIPDFSNAGTFGAIEAALTGSPQHAFQDLADLGINAIELLPITSTRHPPTSFNWGYEPYFYFAVDPDYGSPEDFVDLVEAAHANGIAVIVDMVFNHVGSWAPLERIDEIGGSGEFINYSQTTASAFGMRDLNWFSGSMRQFFLDAALFWIEQYGVDGFRMDLVDPLDYAGYQWWIDEIKTRHTDVFFIAECFNFPPGDAVSQGFDAQWGGQHTDQWGGTANNFQQIVMAILKEGPYSGRAWLNAGSFRTEDNPMWALANVLSATPAYPTFHNEIKYIVSHDERRVADEVDRDGSPEAKIIGGLQKARVGAITLLTTVGIPMLYMGEEIGEDDYVPYIPAPNRVDWNEGDAGLRSIYRNLIYLRLNHPTLAEGGIDFYCPDWSTDQGFCQQNKTICYWRYPGGSALDADIVVAVNFDHDDHVFPVAFPVSGTWHLYDPESGTASPVSVAGQELQVTLDASTANIYLKDTDYIR